MFTSVPHRGNPLAVVLDGQGLDSEETQRFAGLAVRLRGVSGLVAL
ncbi:hypothetical protein [Nonomuraea sp. NPDC052265]